MARKDGVDIGSMELFTDPICNIFGLFCFLVMLLSFLSTLQGTGEPTVSSAIPDMRSNTVLVEEVARLEQQLGASVDPDRDRKLAQLETAKAMISKLTAAKGKPSRQDNSPKLTGVGSLSKATELSIRLCISVAAYLEEGSINI